MLSSLHTLASCNLLTSSSSLSHKSCVASPPCKKPRVSVAFSLPGGGPGSNPIGEEARWLREEQRWLREEQRWLREEHRWLREEQRWKDERQALLQEVCSLKLRIQELDGLLNSLHGPETTVAHVVKLLQEGDTGKNIVSRIAAQSGSIAVVEDSTPKGSELVIEQLISIPNTRETAKQRETLRKGAEGDDVRAMQEALQRLGFYSGEEEMEYCSFSSGTERAVKTWQATLGEPEDGIMTVDLLDRLFKSHGSVVVKLNQDDKESASVVKMINTAARIEDTAATKEEGEVSHGRVFLLGENRWEEPSRLKQGSKGTTTADKKTIASVETKCIACRGEGRLLCTECDGTGEPNVEPQFMEWVDQGAKCPYCDGLGHTTCDVCCFGGK